VGNRGRSLKDIPTAPRTLEYTAADEKHVEKVAKKLGDALSKDQVRALYMTSIGLPDSLGKVPAHRERVQAASMLVSATIPRPKAESEEGGAGATIFVANPYRENICPECGHRFVNASSREDESINETAEPQAKETK
jgi:hypothetical protein